MAKYTMKRHERERERERRNALNDADSINQIKFVESTTKSTLRAIILCAGLGTRLTPITLTKPKPLLEIRGKSTLATALAQILRAKFSNVVYLDGDELREILGHFSYDKNGRIDMALKRAKMAKFLSNQGQIVIVSTISLFSEVYAWNRANLNNYFEIFVECDFDELKKRDQKGLYTKALRGEGFIIGYFMEYLTEKRQFFASFL